MNGVIKKYILYGAGNIGKIAYKKLKDEVYCFADGLKTGMYEGLPVVSLSELKKIKGQYEVLITAEMPVAREIASDLEKEGISYRYYIYDELSDSKVYKSCAQINNAVLAGACIFGKGEEKITFCCENLFARPGVLFDDITSVDDMFDLRNRFINESIEMEITGQETGRKIGSGCEKCVNYHRDRWINDGLIHRVHIAMYPSVCQCKCCYCNVFHDPNNVFNADRDSKYYEKFFEILEDAQRRKLIHEDARYLVASGEISIHPYKDRILRIVEGKKAEFYSNCFKFEERIAKNLHNNSLSLINLSIDSGTAETWYKVKGVNNFEQVISNLLHYHEYCVENNQIQLKYILFPMLNDNIADYQGVINLCKKINVDRIYISCDARTRYTRTEEDSLVLIESTKRFSNILRENGILAINMGNFNGIELEKLQDYFDAR